MSHDIEAIAQGLQIRKPKIASEAHQHIPLSDAERSIVSRLPNSAEYNIILRLLEGEIEKLETAHLKSWRDKEAFVSTGLVAVAARITYENFQKEVNYQASEFVGQRQFEEIEEEVSKMSPAAMFAKSFGA